MGRRGPKPRRIASPVWSAEMAYACGLMASDGCLYNDGRHLNFTAQDIELIEHIRRIFGVTNKISWKQSGLGNKLCPFIQWGDVSLYRWLQSIGIGPAKSLTISRVDVPDQYVTDFLRGEFDGDGYSHAYWDTRWKSSVSLYMGFISGSEPYLNWINAKTQRLYGIKGALGRNTRSYKLVFAKRNAKVLFDAMYYSNKVPHLRRKKKKLDRQWATLQLAQSRKKLPIFIKRGPILRIA